MQTLVRGDSGPSVVYAQERLAAAGFVEVPRTGVFDLETEVVLRLFQLGFRLPPTGVVTDPTWDLLRLAGWATPAGRRPEDLIAASYRPLGILRRGDQGERVRLAQELLVRAGATLRPDGDFGPATDRAIRSFQAERTLAADGVVGPGTWWALLTRAPRGGPLPPEEVMNAAPSVVPDIAPGARGGEARWVQERLVALGYGPLGVDGDYGPRTAAAVGQFQLVRGFPATGTVDVATRIALFGAVDAPVPPATLAAERAELRRRAAFSLDAASGAPREQLLRVIDVALGYLGAAEEPVGSNGGPAIAALVDGYYGRQQEVEQGKPPWCALAVSAWIRIGLGVESWTDTPFQQRFGAVDQYRRWARANERLLPATAAVLPGAVFVMARSGSSSDTSTSATAGHAGLVLVDQGDTGWTSDGNVGNAVQVRHRPKAGLQGFVRWW